MEKVTVRYTDTDSQVKDETFFVEGQRAVLQLRALGKDAADNPFVVLETVSVHAEKPSAIAKKIAANRVTPGQL